MAKKKTKQPTGRRPTEEITPAQRRTQAPVRDFIIDHEFSPTLRELAEILGLGVTPVNDSVNQLIRKGYLTKEPHKRRSLTLTKTATQRVMANRVPDFCSLGLYASVSAGEPALAEDNLIGEALVPPDLVRGGEFFALKVKGESMQNAGIHDGDTVIVKKQQLAQHGDIVVAMIDDEATVKRLYWKHNRIELRPENSKFKPIPVESSANFRILGIVVAVE